MASFIVTSRGPRCTMSATENSICFSPDFIVDAVDAGLVGNQVVEVLIGDANVAIAGTNIIEPAEVDRETRLAVGRERVNRRRQRANLLCFDVEDAAHVLTVFAIVPNHFRLRTGNPLQHASLLPAPGFRPAQLDPAIAVLQIDHADGNFFVGRRLAMFEVDLHAQHVPIGRIEFEFIVVPKPMVFGPLRDHSHGRQSLFFGVSKLAQAKQARTDSDAGF